MSQILETTSANLDKRERKEVKLSMNLTEWGLRNYMIMKLR